MFRPILVSSSNPELFQNCVGGHLELANSYRHLIEIGSYAGVRATRLSPLGAFG